ncbi:serine hydrolase domain-containing protein [Pseudonocardia ailaonensis]|uniref:Serine hydrolase domain-containing protein n=1 Tax=Pseudonocardia ailaonensis TaxID=367279 RepID=A0ABN2NHW8_9PSEU
MDLARATRAVLDWPVDHVAAVVVGAGGVLATAGDLDREFRLASVTKLLSAYALLIAVEEGAVEWDDPAGPEGSTIRHLAAHTSGLAFDSDDVQAEPGTRRIYSNAGFTVLGEAIAEASGIAFADYLREAVLGPLGMAATELRGQPGSAGYSTASDMALFAAELLAPTLVAPETFAAATRVVFPGLNGVLPGYGSQRPNDWGAGFEIRDGKHPHWTGAGNSPRTFGHFGQAGTFLWVDPEIGTACVVLTDRKFGEWAVEAWTPYNDGLLAALTTDG